MHKSSRWTDLAGLRRTSQICFFLLFLFLLLHSEFPGTIRPIDTVDRREFLRAAALPCLATCGGVATLLAAAPNGAAARDSDSQFIPRSELLRETAAQQDEAERKAFLRRIRYKVL